MSIEYAAELPTTATLAIGKICKDPEIVSVSEILSSTTLKTLLRWRNATPRPNWPEDITIVQSSEQIIISFHTGNMEEINEFIQRLRVKIAKLHNMVLNFEEL